MHFTHSATALLALAGNALAAPKKVGLAQAMMARGRSFIGTAVTFRDDPKEEAIYGNKKDFNSITPENAQKWESTEPERGNFTVCSRIRTASSEPYADGLTPVIVCGCRQICRLCHIAWHPNSLPQSGLAQPAS